MNDMTYEALRLLDELVDACKPVIEADVLVEAEEFLTLLGWR